MYGQKKTSVYPRPQIATIVALVKSRCSLIGREYLSDITEADIKITNYSNQRGMCYLRIRDMQYVLNIIPNKERFSIFDGGNQAYSDRTRRRHCHSNVNGNGDYS